MKKINKNKKLRVFEAFAGIGAQVSALNRLNVNFEVVGISEWFINALLCYDAIHNDKKSFFEVPDKEEMIKELSKYTFSRDSVYPITSLSRLSVEEITKLYIANKRSKNYGSITEINPSVLPDFDLLVYSFPCQDLSTGGRTEGMREGSGTRSSLLWEIKRILLGLKEQNRLPSYLLLENVKTIFAKSNSMDLNTWLGFLSELGYHNSSNLVLNALDFGIPQSRKRAFIISSLNKSIDVEHLKNRKRPKSYSIKEFIICEQAEESISDPMIRDELNQAQLKRTYSREIMWDINQRNTIDEDTIIHTITCNMDRSNTAAMFKYKGPKGETYRLLSIREAFYLMGFTKEEYEKTKKLNFSYRKMNKLIGNSIVVNILEEIFRTIYDDFNGRDS